MQHTRVQVSSIGMRRCSSLLFPQRTLVEPRFHLLARLEIGITPEKEGIHIIDAHGGRTGMPRASWAGTDSDSKRLEKRFSAYPVSFCRCASQRPRMQEQPPAKHQS